MGDKSMTLQAFAAHMVEAAKARNTTVESLMQKASEDNKRIAETGQKTFICACKACGAAHTSNSAHTYLVIACMACGKAHTLNAPTLE